MDVRYTCGAVPIWDEAWSKEEKEKFSEEMAPLIMQMADAGYEKLGDGFLK